MNSSDDLYAIAPTTNRVNEKTACISWGHRGIRKTVITIPLDLNPTNPSVLFSFALLGITHPLKSILTCPSSLPSKYTIDQLATQAPILGIQPVTNHTLQDHNPPSSPQHSSSHSPTH
ncbi:hypothetical protein PCANC_28580 [Puccinia coronata f. sp. avenae]|uniref:Uncharacterized protein n=1 Tax=Puccinia coronata f. sp. avenae TaxID=200324 RepID=A0A2N5TAJ7_9BASI|nr:hypothetical protein PCANC_28580 [Puccinia coronata f. sp. avenae]